MPQMAEMNGLTRRDPRTYAIIGAAMWVHSILGPGFLERVYHEAMHVALARRAIPYETEVPLPIEFDGVVLPTRYRADLLCHGAVLVELKAQSNTGGVEDAQVLNYLAATGLQTGLLLNFGTDRLEFTRYVGRARSRQETCVSVASATSVAPVGAVTEPPSRPQSLS